MYYHARPLKYISYGRVSPPPTERVGDFLNSYRWLGKHCGYSPQVWLSRSTSEITSIRRFWKCPESDEQILFGFENIQGFPLSYESWCLIIHIINQEPDLSKHDDLITAFMDEYAACEENDPIASAWRSSPDLNTYLSRHVFVKVDQVVVPSLNLKAAKKIICRNERQKSILRKMGFIEDRLLIKNLERTTY